jgi:hypothetical protein
VNLAVAFSAPGLRVVHDLRALFRARFSTLLPLRAGHASMRVSGWLKAAPALSLKFRGSQFGLGLLFKNIMHRGHCGALNLRGARTSTDD